MLVNLLSIKLLSGENCLPAILTQLSSFSFFQQYTHSLRTEVAYSPSVSCIKDVERHNILLKYNDSGLGLILLYPSPRLWGCFDYPRPADLPCFCLFSSVDSLPLTLWAIFSDQSCTIDKEIDRKSRMCNRKELAVLRH